MRRHAKKIDFFFEKKEQATQAFGFLCFNSALNRFKFPLTSVSYEVVKGLDLLQALRSHTIIKTTF